MVRKKRVYELGQLGGRVKEGLVIVQTVVDWNVIHHGLWIFRVVLQWAGAAYKTRSN